MVDLINTLHTARIVPVIRHHDPDIATLACDLLIDAGVGALEITITVPDAGALCVGMGGNLLPATPLEAGDTTTAREQIIAALAAGPLTNS